MPDTFQNASTSRQSATLPDNAAHCPDADPAERRSAVRPSGLPIFSTESLTEAERQKLLDLQRRYRGAADLIEDCLDCGRVDRALDALQFLERDVGTLPTEIALRLGSNR